MFQRVESPLEAGRRFALREALERAGPGAAEVNGRLVPGLAFEVVKAETQVVPLRILGAKRREGLRQAAVK